MGHLLFAFLTVTKRAIHWTIRVLGEFLQRQWYDRIVRQVGRWDRSLRNDASWSTAGLPETVHSDNAADFRSRAFARACREEGIKSVFRSMGAPHYGGHIERLIGTTMERVDFFIPGRPSPILALARATIPRASPL